MPPIIYGTAWKKERTETLVAQALRAGFRGIDRDIREFCTRHGIAYQSFWTLTANPHLLADDTVRRLSLQYGRTPAQILFRYLTQVGVTPLTAARCSAAPPPPARATLRGTCRW